MTHRGHVQGTSRCALSGWKVLRARRPPPPRCFPADRARPGRPCRALLSPWGFPRPIALGVVCCRDPEDTDLPGRSSLGFAAQPVLSVFSDLAEAQEWKRWLAVGVCLPQSWVQFAGGPWVPADSRPCRVQALLASRPPRGEAGF